MSHLDLDSRYLIRKGLEERNSFSQIAEQLGVSSTTVSREIRSHFIVKRTGGHGSPFNDCKLRFNCTLRGICKGCLNDKKCRFCNLGCVNRCLQYEKEHCSRLKKPPYVCNGCIRRFVCTMEKHLYEPSAAQKEYEAVWRESHTGLSYSEDEIRQIDEIVTPLIRKGQSPNHILLNHSEELMVSRGTLYRLIEDGLLQAKDMDLPRKVRYRARRKPRVLKVDKQCRIGRSYPDYLSYLNEHPDTATVQIDSVEGKKGGKVLLTVHFVNTELMLAFLRERNDSASVTACFDSLYDTLGQEDFTRLFPVLLADNGSEFSNPSKIEFEWKVTGELRTQVFYCDPGASWQKGSAERNHEFIRCVIPKGTDMNSFRQQDIDLLVNHMNSYCRDSLGGKSPYDAFCFFYGKEILDKLGIQKIHPDEVKLKPSLLKKRKEDAGESH